jgi:hypothetical protein
LLAVLLNRFINDFAKVFENLSLISAMAAAEKKAGTASNEALIFLGPLDNLDVSGAFAHLRNSPSASFTAFSG